MLDNVSFSVPPGKITGLVARTGAGRTTFFRLGLRFYDAQNGTIELNGTPTPNWTSVNCAAVSR